MSTVAYPHIEFRTDGVPLIAGTQTKVCEVVLDRLAFGWDTDEIQRQHPHLSLAQIHAAFTYYYDHPGEIDDAIEAGRQSVEQYRERLENQALASRLKSIKPAP